MKNEDAFSNDTPNRNKGNPLLRQALQVLPLAGLGTLLATYAPPSSGSTGASGGGITGNGASASDPFVGTSGADAFVGGGSG